MSRPLENRGFGNALGAFALVVLIAGCSSAGSGLHAQVLPQMGMPRSVSPALIKAAPMAKTAIQPPSAMQSRRRTMGDVQGTNWTQLPGSASQVSASPDGSIWVLSTQPSGPDKYIWHYVSGAWTNIAGLAAHLAVAPNDTLYAVNSGGGTYAYSGGNWSALGGGASGITAAADGSIYVLSNGGSGDQAIWHNVNGAWSQVPGSGVAIAASWDTSNYSVPGGRISSGGLYILNTPGSIYYENSGGSFATLPGNASAIAPTTVGGVYVLGYPSNSGGNTIYYYNLNNPGWTAQTGAGVSISTNGTTLYVIGASGAIYASPITPIPQPGNGTPLNPIATNSVNGGWAPYASANAFDFPVQSGYNGTGFTVGIIIDALPNQGDVSTYLSQYGIQRTGSITPEAVDGGSTNAPSGEETLDTESVAALAPGANVIIYNVPSLSGQYLTDAYNQVVSDGYASAVSMSIGGCEDAYSQSVDAPIFQTAANKGITFIASSGDQGDECYSGGTPQYQYGANYPASDPNVIGVGGTETNPPANPITSTVAWNDSSCVNGSGKSVQCATGGGVSTLFALPPYQSGVAGEASTTDRNVPDVAMPAEDDAVYLNGSWILMSGTSWSAPQFAAMLAEIDEYCNVSFTGAASSLYSAYSTNAYNDFIDVLSGNNTYNGVTGYSAGTGYDNVSGIGLPLGMPIAKTICPNRVPLSVTRKLPITTSSFNTLAPAQARELPPAPRMRGLRDIGMRPLTQRTRIVLVLRPTSALAANEAIVLRVLQSSGFTILKTYSDNLVIDAAAPADTINRFFSTAIHNVSQPRYGERYTNASPLLLPASIASYVSGAIADNLVTMKTL